MKGEWSENCPFLFGRTGTGASGRQRLPPVHTAPPGRYQSVARATIRRSADGSLGSNRKAPSSGCCPFLVLGLGLLEAHEGNWQPALEHLGRAWTQDRSNPTVALVLARMYRRVNRPREALQLLSSLGPASRDSSAVHFELAQISTRRHRSVEAQAERDVFSRL